MHWTIAKGLIFESRLESSPCSVRKKKSRMDIDFFIRIHHEASLNKKPLILIDFMP